jgi:hypothetical protein
MVRLSLAIVFADEVALSDPDSDVGATGGRPLVTTSVSDRRIERRIG